MDASTQKLELIEWLLKLQDQALLDNLSSIKDSLTVQKNEWNELSTREKESIQRGLDDAEAGRVISHEEVMRKYAKYQ